MRRALVSLAELQNSLRNVSGISPIIRNAGYYNAGGHQRSTVDLGTISKNMSAISRNIGIRNISTSRDLSSKQTNVEEVEGEEDVEAQEEAAAPIDTMRDSGRDRTAVIPVELSMRYLESPAFKETYGDHPVWFMYRRNFKGQYAPTKTRKTCSRVGQLQTRNPCPLCRDEFLVVDYRNTKLLKQFISPFNGAVLHWDKTGVCRTKQLDLEVEIQKAWDYGTITFDVPVRTYDYDDYYGNKPRSYL